MEDYIAKNPNLQRAGIIKVRTRTIQIFWRNMDESMFDGFLESAEYALLQFLASAPIIPSEGAQPLDYLRKYIRASKFYCDDWKVAWHDNTRERYIFIHGVYLERLGDYMLLREAACESQKTVHAILPQPIAEEIIPQIAL